MSIGTRAPIILIHYGDSSYLRYVVKLAKRFNPDKEIIFIGDEHNQYVTSLGASHYPLESLRHSPELHCFDQLYPRIVNPRYPKSKWAQFVFQRWFIINTFIHNNNIDRFWTFDSDNFVLTDLTAFEDTFSQYDCTSQCSGNCLNGFVSNKNIVQRYVSRMTDLLRDDNFVDSWHQKYAENPQLFYNEMEAFAIFTKQEGISHFHLAQIRDGAMFDDSITYENGMETCRKSIKGRQVKKLYMHDGEIYCKHVLSGTFIRMHNLNLSWMPKYIFPLLFKYIVSVKSQEGFAELDLHRAPLSYHVKLLIRNQIPKSIRDRISRGRYWV
jgi:hypothetical protein